MKNSRNIDDLRPDVAANCRTLIQMAQRQGLKILVTGTVRDNEYQEYCYRNGTAKTKIPSFHSEKAGLAFDICQNIKGAEYSDLSFFRNVAILAKRIGFSWGGDWKSFPDRPHFQWDEHGKYTNSMVRAGKYPPKMPLYIDRTNKEEETMTQEQFNAMMDTYLASRDKLLISPWASDGMTWAVDNGILTGDEDNNLKPQAFVTREQLAVMLQRTTQRGVM